MCPLCAPCYTLDDVVDARALLVKAGPRNAIPPVLAPVAVAMQCFEVLCSIMRFENTYTALLWKVHQLDSGAPWPEQGATPCDWSRKLHMRAGC